MWRSEMNDTSIVTMSTSDRQVSGLERPRVRALDDDHARIVPKTPVELAVADVERDDAARAALEQHVGEPAGRGADVERLAAVDGDAECVERMRQLDAAAADVRMVRLLERDRRRHPATGVPGFLRGLAVDQHDAGQNQRARTLARRRQAALRRADTSIAMDDLHLQFSSFS